VTATISITEVTGLKVGAFTQKYTGTAPPLSPPGTNYQAFDFNNGGSPTYGTFTGVQPGDTYTPSRGYGWQTAVSGYDRGSGGTPATLFQDGAWGYTSGTFQVSMPAGSYDVRVYVGDPYQAWGGLTVTAGAQTAAVDTNVSRFGYVTLYGVPAVGGVVSVTINGGIWVASGVEMALAGSLPAPSATGTPAFPAGGLRLDFNGPSALTAAGFTPAAVAPYPTGGAYGWSGGVGILERAAATLPATLTPDQVKLYQDGAWSQGTAVFQVAVAGSAPTQAYTARVYIGDSFNNWPGITLKIEGNPTPVTADTAARPDWSYILPGGKDVNGDGFLTVTVDGPVWVVNGIDVVKGAAGSLPASAGPAGSPQVAAGGVVAGGAAPVLTADQLAPVVEEALARWEAAGITPEQLALLRAVRYEITDLNATGYLGRTEVNGGVVELDDDGAGRGWFVDHTPADDAEFIAVGPTELTAAVGPAAAGYDLLTVVMHELGHVIGLDSLDPAAASHDLMTAALSVGTRRLAVPSAGWFAAAEGAGATVPAPVGGETVVSASAAEEVAAAAVAAEPVATDAIWYQQAIAGDDELFSGIAVG
jgi:hypothetical protein